MDSIEQRGAGLVITVDEVRVEVEEMVQLVSVYQLLIREGHRVALVMAGLPTAVTDLVDDGRVAFLRRARKHYIGRIEDSEVRRAFAQTIRSAGKDVVPGALDEAVAAAGGFAYMMQLVGYFIWQETGEGPIVTRDDALRGAEAAESDFRRGVLEATYREMSKGDRAFARAMCQDIHGSTLAEVARRMGKSTSYASTYKRRLLKQGIIGERAGTTFDFDIPSLRDFLMEIESEQ